MTPILISEESESTILGCIACGYWPEDVELRAEMFAGVHHETLFNALKAAHDKGASADILAAKREAGKLWTLEVEAEAHYCLKQRGDATYHARVIKTLFKKRQLLNALRDVENRIEDEGIFDYAERALFGAVEGEKAVIKGGRELAKEASALVTACFENKGKIRGCPTGLKTLDGMTGGFESGCSYVIAARPSVGKSALMMNAVQHISLDLKVPCLVFSMEMSRQELMIRLLSGMSGISCWHIKSGHYPAEEAPKLTGCCAKISSAPLFINDKGYMTIQGIRSEVRRAVKKWGIKVVFADYLQLIHGKAGKDDKREQEVSAISAGFKALAKECGVACVVLSQLNRNIEYRSESTPRLADLRESGAIEQDADQVWMLSRAIHGEDGDVTQAKLFIAKNRNGATGTIDLTYSPSHTQFTEPQPTIVKA